jgi:hypothetical protein
MDRALFPLPVTVSRLGVGLPERNNCGGLLTESNRIPGVCVRRRLIAPWKNSGHLLFPRPIAPFVIAPEYRPEAIVRCSPSTSGYSRQGESGSDKFQLVSSRFPG